MQIMINYDLLEAVKDSNEKFGLKKITRNYKRLWLKCHIPLFITVNYFSTGGNIGKTIRILPLQLSYTYFLEYILHHRIKGDRFKIESDIKLARLVSQFNDSYVETSQELIKQSTLYDKKYEVKLNEKKIPDLIQSKYILVPAYDYSGSINNVSIKQEHVVGSKEYILSLGSPKKVLKPAFSSI